MRKALFVLMVSLVFVFGFVTQSEAGINAFNIFLIDVVEDTANAGLGAQDSWYQWIYKVEKGESQELSHFFIDLEDCFDSDFGGLILSTAGYNGVPPNDDNLLGLDGNEFREYEVEYGQDGHLGDPKPTGIKWNLVDSDDYNFEDDTDFDYFWFSVPVDLDSAVLRLAHVKYGQNNNFIEVWTPGCPDCDDPNAIPEPAFNDSIGKWTVGNGGFS